MSLSVNGQHVLCDGAECQAHAAVPIALRPVLTDDRITERTEGWLYMAIRGEWRHYCPNCLPLYFECLITSPETEPIE